MSYAPYPLRPGFTALAAVLALSSTASIAQSADTPVAADPAQPVLVTPPPVSTAPVSTTPVITPAPSAAPAASASAPISTAETVDSTPAPAPALKAPAPVAHQADRAALSSPAAQVRPKAAKAAPAPAAAPTVAKVAKPVPAPVVASIPAVQRVQPAPAAPATQRTAREADDLTPLAGAAGITVLLLGGAYALSRRRRQDEQPEMIAAASPASIDAPIVPAREATHEPATVAAIPAGFDISRFGRHTQAAYRGPTPENPSLSLKRRLKRASFFDARERMAATPSVAQGRSQAMADAKPVAPRPAEHVTTRIGRPQRPAFRPAYQS